ncbi:putative isoamylase [Helianthus annuus]|uniref:Isoamylase n=2 Tax=Helianthus annuus TaxID=4232 RepID=A0A9K3DYZ7_HELAN|nr:isoamylase 2, chloroplastic [Helianthus annuus]XP_022010634.1 isoamylase 2, chloroplastic [Helianthus annuus]XP_035839999.1 isoamylase 2, chloroplastic [Helianthus annuus]XP_035840000.1 isoamylase 2, chloroplastic [Helianthus annuus]KAF5762923.1 putative isoamylase [Helianthus annuus]KAJ0449905.1 putative isoamylase [Helianthus annuus]KAJ0471631.1 putative isoamylase [Helianthus annuus]KAJ0647271.1 putative isoamylase [Helianthus annuus]KAJ0829736.1 putative isoamylase [Helianthus annuus
MSMLSLSSATQPTCLTCGTIKISKLIIADSCKYGRRATQSFGRMDLGQNLVFGKTAKNIIKGLYHNPRFGILAASTLPVIQTAEKLSTYLFRTEKGGNVTVIITRLKDGKYGVNVEISSLQLTGNDADIIMSWGVFRSDSSSRIPIHSSDSGIFETPFAIDSLNKFSAELEFDASLAPFYISFLLKWHLDGETVEIKSHRKTNFCFPVGVKSGRPGPLGVSYSADGSLNFALFSRNAKSVILCLFDDSSSEEPVIEIDLDPYVNRSGDIWHVSMDNAMNFVSYGYRVKNDGQEKSSVVLDPYSKVIAENSLGKICKEPTFDWSDDVRPNLPMEKLTVYRLNVMDFTRDASSNLPDEIRGTFSAISEKLHHLKDLGVNAVLLEPIAPYDKLKGPYYPSHFFSPQNSYGPHGDSTSTINSMNEMVKRLHANGIEVLLEVVVTHTCDSSSLAKIDKPSYYYSNNALNCAHPVVQQLILDSLKHWVINYHIDGFCFIDSSSMINGFNGEHLSRPPLIEAIAFDPVLSKTKIIADSFDPLLNSTKEIQFPHWKKWAEMNSRFCSDVRNYLRGESLVSNLATRLCGSGDIFLNGRGPAFSFNFVARNHGLSLVDLVSFSSASELSWNCGEEGATKKRTVLETRLKQIRNFLFILYVSLGVPVLNMGDECGQSSGGKISVKERKPFNWKSLKTGFAVQTIEFISFLSSLKIKRSDLLQRREFLKVENIDWYGPDLSLPNWEDPTSKFLAMSLKCDQNDENALTSDMFVAFNGGDSPVTATLPPPRLGMEWVRLVDTGLPYPGFFSTTGEPVVEKIPGSLGYQMTPHSCVLLEARNVDG